jgi:nucleotide-binding universal stress UspA family protein
MNLPSIPFALAALRGAPAGLGHVLVPVDFSEGSRAALELAAGLAHALNARLTVLHIAEVAPRGFAGAVADFPEIEKELRAAAEARMAEFTAAVQGSGVVVQTEVRCGFPFAGEKPAAQIVAAAASIKADLIVIGTHGRTGLDRALLGSTAEYVVRHAPCAVLTVRGGRAAKPGPRRIPGRLRLLVPVDFSECSLQAVRYAADVARRVGAQMTLIHVVEPVRVGWLRDMKPALRAATALQQQAAQQLGELSKGEPLADLTVQRLVRTGKPAEVITHLADLTNADAIVISTHGHTGLRRALLGSVTEKIVRQARCPVLVVRASAAS